MLKYYYLKDVNNQIYCFCDQCTWVNQLAGLTLVSNLFYFKAN